MDAVRTRHSTQECPLQNQVVLGVIGVIGALVLVYWLDTRSRA